MTPQPKNPLPFMKTMDDALAVSYLANWLSVRYALATRRLMETEGPEQWRLLRELCGDVVELRRGDHNARRLELERARVAAIERDADLKWKRKIVIGLETLAKEIEHNPQARAAFSALNDILRHPCDPTESSIPDHVG